MIVRNNKSVESNSMYPDVDWYGEGNYVVDETTPEGKALAEKIIRLYPNYDLVVENGQLIDVTEALPPIPTEAEIDAQVVAKIRERYDQNEEYKMLRFGILDATNPEFLAYNTYAEECRAWGQAEKVKYGLIGE